VAALPQLCRRQALAALSPCLITLAGEADLGRGGGLAARPREGTALPLRTAGPREPPSSSRSRARSSL
jgi:hypothetical protein